MAIDIFLDHCVWDFLFERKIILEEELSSPDFNLYITRQAEFEIDPIPTTKQELRDYVLHCIEACPIKTRAYFGFYNPAYPIDEQRAGGFGLGELAGYQEVALMKELRQQWGRNQIRPTKLYKNEADIALAVRSISSVVLTLDKKRGPLADMVSKGGRIIFLNEFDSKGKSLRSYILEQSGGIIRE